jgi:replicative superfamily II helicase
MIASGLSQNLRLPDPWQQQAVHALREGKDVVVHAPTGAGKTHIFELLHGSIRGQTVFTVPTRALANDKLADWQARGWDVGIATGDVALRLDARVIVATLETQKGNLLRRHGPRLLVIDEYQMIGDEVRGVNYELAIALAPLETQLLLLSGSVANPQDVVTWLQRIGRQATLVAHAERPVPLEEIDLEALPNRAPAATRGRWPRLIANALRAELGPILMFAPRRRAAEELAEQLAANLPSIEALTLVELCAARGIDRTAGKERTTARGRCHDGPCRRNQLFHAIGRRHRDDLSRWKRRSPGPARRTAANVRPCRPARTR